MRFGSRSLADRLGDYKLDLPTELIVHPLQAFSSTVLGVLHFAWFGSKTAREIGPAELPQRANKVAEFL